LNKEELNEIKDTNYGKRLIARQKVDLFDKIIDKFNDIKIVVN